MKTVLVTGAAGFLGSHLAEHYLKKNYHVIGVDNLSTSNMNNVDYLKAKFPGYVFHKFDACGDWGFLKNEIKGSLAYGDFVDTDVAQGRIFSQHNGEDRRSPVQGGEL